MDDLGISAATSLWTENTDGTWTWHPEPDVPTIYAPFRDCDLLRVHGSFHEAGHVIAALTIGLGVDSVQLAPSEQGHMFHTVISGDVYRWSDYAACLAAGERAASKWLREIGEWTPERAWSIERGAKSDRANAAKFAARIGEPFDFLAHPWGGWAQVCSWADGRLKAHWDRVTALADALMGSTSLDAQAVARITDLPNAST
ncbi:hypothetical protein [Streptomyces bluensis]|uniref:hypothetical protein n=1 Tax=Streptomyces bluensis TaxID=33897 RepID=UPI00331702AE